MPIASEATSSAASSEEPPRYPIPSERSTKSASVVPTVVVATITIQ
jgi:hypothetical protein